MISKNTNIEEIKFLIPDYITGSLDEKQMLLVREAIDNYPELNEFYADMKSTFEFVDKVEFEEPVPQYWNNLLPRIHQKIEEREEKQTSKNPFALIWKILVPVAAVIILFVVYMIANNPGEDVLDKNKTLVKTDSVKKDTEQKQNTTDIKENNTQENTADNIKNTEKPKRNISPDSRIKEQEQQEKVYNDEEKADVPLVESDDVADVIQDEALILGAGGKGTFDEDIENEIDELSQNEKDVLLEQLSKSDL